VSSISDDSGCFDLRDYATFAERYEFDAFSSPEEVEATLIQFNIQETVLKNLYLYLGQGDLEKGKKEFEHHLKSRSVSLEQNNRDLFGFSEYCIAINTQQSREDLNALNIQINHKGEIRSVTRLILSANSTEQEIEAILAAHGISKAALKNLYVYLGNGDLIVGKGRFNEHLRNRCVTIERVGKSKKSFNAKYYLMLPAEELGRGNWNMVHIAASPKGTVRAASRPLPNKSVDASNLENAEAFFGVLEKQYRGSIVKLMNHERGIKVMEVGGKNNLLGQIDAISKLSKKERLTILLQIIHALSVLGHYGFVHTDLHGGNVVWECSIVDGKMAMRAQIIDVDRMKQEGQSHQTNPKSRCSYYSPERLLREDRGEASHKDDIWAAMCIFCLIECSVKNESDRLLSPKMIQRFKSYLTKLDEKDQGVFKNQTREQLDLHSRSLFSSRDCRTDVDRIVYDMARTSAVRRPRAKELFPRIAETCRTI